MTEAGTLPRTAASPRARPAERYRQSLPVTLYLLTLVIPIFFYVGPLYMGFLRLLLLVMILPTIGMLLSGRLGRILPTDWLMVVHLMWITLSLAITEPHRVVQVTGSAGVEFLGGYMLARAYIRTREDFIAMVRMLAIITVCTLPFALVESLGQGAFILDAINEIPFIESNSDVNYAARTGGLLRAQTVFAHPIHYGVFCSISFVLVFVGLAPSLGRGPRWALSAGIAACTFLSLSSGALLAVMLQTFLIGWAFLLRGSSRPWLILTLLVTTAYVLIDILSDRTPIQVFMSYATFSPHNAYWRQTIFEYGMASVWRYPFIGLGLGQWERPWWMFSASMDNFWLVMAVRHGILGFVTLALPYGLGLWAVGRRDFSGDTVLLALRRAWVIAFVGMTFTLVTVHIWSTLYSFVFFMFGAGMWMIGTDPQREGDAEEAAPEPAPQGRARYTRFPTTTRDLPATLRTAPAAGKRP